MQVLVWSAASASCALPGLFSSVELMCKDHRGQVVPYFAGAQVRWTDGSLHTDLPTVRLQELFNVNYFIVSQTNPHALPFFQHLQRNTAVKRPTRDKPPPTLLQKFVSKVTASRLCPLSILCFLLVTRDD
jgi:predicted acylesterase/phospholipase RssA